MISSWINIYIKVNMNLKIFIVKLWEHGKIEMEYEIDRQSWLQMRTIVEIETRSQLAPR